MTAIVLRIIIYAAIAGFIYFGVRRLWRDLTGQVRGTGSANRRVRPQPDLNEQARPDVIELKRGADGVYRPGGDSDRR